MEVLQRVFLSNAVLSPAARGASMYVPYASNTKPYARGRSVRTARSHFDPALLMHAADF